MKLIELKKERDAGKKIVLDYSSDSYYQVEINQTIGGFRVDFIKKNFEVPFVKKMYATLFEEQWDHPIAFACILDNQEVGIIEMNKELWSNRLRVTNIAVDESFKRNGIGTCLMNKAKDIAKEEGFRQVILETQTSNMKAINFYQSQGFEFGGFDSSCYSDKDIQNNEVRLEMIYKVR